MSQAISDPQLLVRSWQSVAGAIDHTLLEPEVTREQVIRLCREAHFYHFAAICVNPCWINLAVSVLQGTEVKIATTIGFPLGASQTTVKRFEAAEAILTGAQELEMVMNIGALKSGDRQLVQADIAAVTEISHQHGALVKVILETGMLTLEEKILSCELALAAGADFVKTASGFAGSGATVDDIALLCGVVGDRARVKASGGIHTATTALALLEAGANRLGTSHAVSIVKELGGPEFST
ncbi:MAG: deoxyribose-phosphate aldolase [Acidobacteriia bacterium]|nr:deoxyribose-phosphate aldolase [Terriglobia bacterium]